MIEVDAVYSSLNKLVVVLSINVLIPNCFVFAFSLITVSLNDHFWQEEENEFHLCEAAAALINCFLEDYESYNSVER